MTTYKLQHWVAQAKGFAWKTIESSTNKPVVERAYKGWCRQLRDGTFRIITAKGSVVKIRRGPLYKKVYKT